MSEKFHRRSLLTPTRTPPSMVVRFFYAVVVGFLNDTLLLKVKLRGSATSDDVQGVLAKMIVR